MPERTTTRPNLSVALVGVVLGVVYLVIGVATGQTGYGIAGLVLMLAYAGLMYGLRRRSESAQLLTGNVPDGRQALVSQGALALTGAVMVWVVVIGFLVCLATQSRYTGVFAGLSAVGGVAFVSGIVWFSRRS